MCKKKSLTIDPETSPFKSNQWKNKAKTSLGLESYEELGFNSIEELELEISKLTKFRPEFDTNLE